MAAVLSGVLAAAAFLPKTKVRLWSSRSSVLLVTGQAAPRKFSLSFHFFAPPFLFGFEFITPALAFRFYLFDRFHECANPQHNGAEIARMRFCEMKR